MGSSAETFVETDPPCRETELAYKALGVSLKGKEPAFKGSLQRIACKGLSCHFSNKKVLVLSHYI